MPQQLHIGTGVHQQTSSCRPASLLASWPNSSPGHSSSLPRRFLRAVRLWGASARQHPTLREEQTTATDSQPRGGSQQPASVSTDEDWGRLEVVLQPRNGSSLGIALAGGDTGCARVAGVRPGSTAHSSDALSVGDYVSAVNGVRCERLRSEQVAALLRRAEQAGGPVALELRYPLPPPSGTSERRRVSFVDEEMTRVASLHRGALDQLYATFPMSRPALDRVVERAARRRRLHDATLTPTYGEQRYNVTETTDRATQIEQSLLWSRATQTTEVVIKQEHGGTTQGIQTEEIPQSDQNNSVQSSARCYQAHCQSTQTCIRECYNQGTQTIREPLCFSQGIQTDFYRCTRGTQTPSVYQLVTTQETQTTERLILCGMRCNPNQSNQETQTHCRISTTHQNTLRENQGTQTISDVATSHQRYQGTQTSSANNRKDAGSSTTADAGFSRVVQVSLQRDEAGSLGFNLRGGAHPEPDRSRSLVVTQVRPGGPADRSGCVRPGDRLLAVDGTSLIGASLQQAHDALRPPGIPTISSTTQLVRLSLEVDVSPQPLVLHQGPILVEVERAGGDPALGLALSAAPSGGVLVAGVRPGSVADRCGALHAGDLLLAVAGTRVDEGLGPMEAAQLLAQSGSPVRLQVLPQQRGGGHWGSLESGLSRGAGVYAAARLGSSSSYLGSSSHSTLTSRGRHASVTSRRPHESSISTLHETTGSSSQCGCHQQAHGVTVPVSHSETLIVSLLPDYVSGYGLALEGSAPPLIAAIEPGSPADLSGCLQPGDRVLAVNGTSCEAISGAQAARLVEGAPVLTLLTQFDVAEAVVPASGVFTVNLAVRGSEADLGLTLDAPCGGGAPVVAAVRRGSAAHRSGALQRGDRLLEVGGVRLAGGPVSALQALGEAAQRQDVVSLRVLKAPDSPSARDADERALRRGSAVVYSVELARRGGPLGLTVAGTEDASQPVTISALTPGGLAERTGALHVGDRLLAINGHCLQGRRLSEAVEWLQGAGDRVTLQVSRGGSPAPLSFCSSEEQDEEEQARPSGALRVPNANPSVDSAVESWSSGGPNSPGTEYNAESSTVLRRPPRQLHQNLQTPRPRRWPEDEAEESQRDSSADSGQSGGSPAPPLPPPWRTGDEETVEDVDEDVAALSPPRCATLPSRARAASPASPANSCLPDVYQVTLRKDRVYEDFGFSVSDGLYERGVYVNRIRRGGPADLSGRLRPYDRILQVNDTRTQDFDCCLTVPLIAAAGDTLEITVARNPFAALAPSPSGGEDPWLCEQETLPPPQCVTESL